MKEKKQVFYDPPEYVLNEWELLNLIISYTSIFYNPSEDDKVIHFTTNEIKEYYNYFTFQNFDKIYGENGLQELLFFRNGIKYNSTKDIWNLYPIPFLKYLQLEYIKDEEIYGKNFYNLWKNRD